MGRSLNAGTDYSHPKSLRAEANPDPKILRSEHFLSEIGEVFDYALDRAQLTDKEAAALMGYSNQAIVSDWKSGRERVQLDKLRRLGDRFWGEFVCGLAQLVEGVQVRTVIELRRPA